MLAKRGLKKPAKDKNVGLCTLSREACKFEQIRLLMIICNIITVNRDESEVLMGEGSKTREALNAKNPPLSVAIPLAK